MGQVHSCTGGGCGGTCGTKLIGCYPSWFYVLSSRYSKKRFEDTLEEEAACGYGGEGLWWHCRPQGEGCSRLLSQRNRLNQCLREMARPSMCGACAVAEDQCKLVQLSASHAAFDCSGWLGFELVARAEVHWRMLRAVRAPRR